MPLKIHATLYYLNGCPPCNALKPEWAVLENFLQKGGKKFNVKNHYNTVNFTCEKIESSLIPPEKKDEIEGFPTIQISIKGGSKSEEVDYKGERNADAIYKEMATIAHKITKHPL
jgi:hypothetical protein